MESGNAQLSAAMDFLFHHAKWEGLHFWDLVQPFFMFIVGVSIPLSYANRKKSGATEKAIRNHAFRRAFLLLLFGYNLKEDPKEQNNLAAQHPEIVGQIDSIQRIAHRHPHIREWEFIDPKYKR